MGASTLACWSLSRSVRVRCSVPAADETLLDCSERLVDQAFERAHLLILPGLQLLHLILQLRHVALDRENIVPLLAQQQRRAQREHSTREQVGNFGNMFFTSQSIFQCNRQPRPL